MVANIDPVKARYYPEILPEAISITPSASGASIATYSAFSPFAIFLKDVWSNQFDDITLRVDNDSGYGAIESPTKSRPERLPVEQNLVCHESLDLFAVGDAVESYIAYTMRIAQMTVLEKIIHNVTLSDQEKALGEQFEIKKKFNAGILYKNMNVMHNFKKIIEIAKEVTVAAGSHTRVGRLINVKRGEKVVLLGLSVDRDAISADFGGAGSSDTYITINRDVRDTEYVKLDCLAMPSLDNEMQVYIPAINRHEIIIESATGVTDLPIRYRYGIADISILEKIRWEIRLTAKETSIAEEFNLFNAVIAGVM